MVPTGPASIARTTAPAARCSTEADAHKLGRLMSSDGSPEDCGSDNAALNRPAMASSVERRRTRPSAAVDGNPRTRWSSQFADPQWLQVDLGSTVSVCEVVLTWERAYASAFEIQVSTDGSDWTGIYRTDNGRGGMQSFTVTGVGRYVRMFATDRATRYGYSLWEFVVRVRVSAAQKLAEPRQSGRDSSPAEPSPTPSQSAEPSPSRRLQTDVPSQAVQPSAQDAGSFWGDTNSIPATQNVLTVKILNRTNGRYPDSQVFWSFKRAGAFGRRAALSGYAGELRRADVLLPGQPG